MLAPVPGGSPMPFRPSSPMQGNSLASDVISRLLARRTQPGPFVVDRLNPQPYVSSPDTMGGGSDFAVGPAPMVHDFAFGQQPGGFAPRAHSAPLQLAGPGPVHPMHALGTASPSTALNALARARAVAQTMQHLRRLRPAGNAEY